MLFAKVFRSQNYLLPKSKTNASRVVNKRNKFNHNLCFFSIGISDATPIPPLHPPFSSRGEGGTEILLGEFFNGWREPKEEWSWQFKPLFQNWKQLSVHTEHQLKSKLRWPKCPKSTKLKLKWNRSNDCSWKWCFYWVITWKLLFRGGINL